MAIFLCPYIATVGSVTTVIGIDKTKGGWVAVGAEEGRIQSCRFVETVREVVTLWPDASAYGIDIPLFLVESGTRAAETALRELLGPAARSMFTSPTRAALDASTQAEATAINRAHGGPGISAQAFGLFAAVREARGVVSGLPPSRRTCWWETHPESAFVVLARSSDKPTPASKRSAAGVLERIALLESVYTNLLEVDTSMLPNQVKIDDVLDAAAAAWSAQRVLSGEALVFGSGATDTDGHRDVVAI